MNRMRATLTWMGKYSEKMVNEFVDVARDFTRLGAKSEYRNLTDLTRIRDGRTCRDFSWFIHRFKEP